MTNDEQDIDPREENESGSSDDLARFLSDLPEEPENPFNDSIPDAKPSAPSDRERVEPEKDQAVPEQADDRGRSGEKQRDQSRRKKKPRQDQRRQDQQGPDQRKQDHRRQDQRRQEQRPSGQRQPEQRKSEARRPEHKGQARERKGGPSKGVDLSIVIPLLNEKDSLAELAEKIKSALREVTERWEVLFVDDGSTDGSFDVLKKLHHKDRRYKVIRFRRNFGKSAALATGFQHVQGKRIVTMDADLQDDPMEIPNLMDKMDEGFDLVSGWKRKRYDPITKTVPSRFFNYVTRKMSGIPIHDFNCGLKAYRRDVVKSLHVYGEMHRYLPVLASMAGFSVSEIPVRHQKRKYGTTKFGMSRFFKGFLDLLTVMFTSRYTQRPLHVFGTIGTFMFMIGIAINIWLTVDWMQGRPISDRPLLFLGILSILVGIQLISTGLLAEMVAKQEQKRPDYGIREILK